MCVFSYSNNFIFFHIPKCAGTSIYYTINEIMNKESFIESTHIRYLKSKKLFEENNKLDWFNKSKKFTIIRNPITRTISLYKYIKTHTDHYLNEKISDYTFKDFCFFLKDNKDENITSCYEHIKDESGNIGHLRIFKLEEINNYISDISKIIGKKITEIPVINTSKFDYKIDSETESIIHDIFEEDFKMFYK